MFWRILLIVIASAAALFAIYAISTIIYLTHGGLEKYFEKRMIAKRDEWNGKPYEKGQILLIGSSFMANWTTSEQDLSPLVTYNSAVGGTRVENWALHVDDMIVPFSPKAVLIYVGSNNINGGATSEKGEIVADKVKKLLDDVHQKLPNAKLYYLSISPSIKRNHVWSESNKCNELVKEYCEKDEHLNFIDLTPALLKEDGSLREEIYGEDKLHYNEKGYVIWKEVIRPILLKEFN